MINYHDKIFVPLHNSENGEVDLEMKFHYQQQGNIVTCTYSGANIRSGHLIALVDDFGVLDMRYHQINLKGEITTGKCRSVPEQLPDGKVRMHEKWQWTSGDLSAGESLLQEI